jgi:hypothetical protein
MGQDSAEQVRQWARDGAREVTDGVTLGPQRRKAQAYIDGLISKVGTLYDKYSSKAEAAETKSTKRKVNNQETSKSRPASKKTTRKRVTKR